MPFNIPLFAFPDSINQHARGTCAATSIQIALAIQEPAKYLDIMTDLMSESGIVDKDNLSDPSLLHEQLRRDQGSFGTDTSGRSVSSRVMQIAFMEFANGKLDYRNSSDRSAGR